MWELKDKKHTAFYNEEYSRTLSGTLPAQIEPTGTLELKKEWLEGIDLDDLLKEDNEIK